ncbi:MAG: hypothetical protein WCO12_01785 [bacterium]
MESLPQQKSQEEILNRGLAYALRVAQAENITDEEAVITIANTVEETMRLTGRPEFMDSLDPGTFHSETKFLSENAKKRLGEGLERYIAKFK